MKEPSRTFLLQKNWLNIVFGCAAIVVLAIAATRSIIGLAASDASQLAQAGPLAIEGFGIAALGLIFGYVWNKARSEMKKANQPHPHA